MVEQADEEQVDAPAVLVVNFGDRIQEYRLSNKVVRVGRSPELEIAFAESQAGVSRHHATLTLDRGSWAVSDAGSRNGTFVNRNRADNTVLADGDEIDFGPVRGTFRMSKSVSANESSKTTNMPPTASLLQPHGQHLTCSINVANLCNQEAFTTPLDSSRPASSSENRSHQFGAETAWAIGFFSEVGRALVASNSLDEMLENMMTETFGQVPAERGLISMLDPATGDLTPRVVRSDDVDSPLRSSRTIIDTAIRDQSSLLVEDTSSDDRFAEAVSIRQMNIRSAMCVPLYSEGQVNGVIYVDTQNDEEPFEPRHLELLTALGLFSAVAIQQATLRDTATLEEQKRKRLARYSSPAVVDRIISYHAEDDDMLADTAEVSVLFGDLRGFTSMSERKTPAEVVEILNAIFTELANAVFEFNGTLDKFMGDGMLAFFGAPLLIENHAECAVRTGLKMQQAIQTFNASRPDEDPIGLRVGINTGPVIVGDIGSTERKDYTVIGDTVNVASRFESSVAKVGEVVLGESTYRAIENTIECEALPPAQLKGKSEPVPAFRVVMP